MSLKNAKEVKKNRYELEIVIDGEKFREAITKVCAKEAKKVNIPGFRKGKAPASFVEKYFGSEAFFEEALNSLYGEAVDEAAAAAGIEIIDDKIDFDLVSISKEEGADFKVTVTTYPEVEVKNYKGLKAERVKSSVSAKEVDEAIKGMAERNARMVEVTDRAAMMGDTAVIDFEGFTDGKAFDGGKGESYSLELGSGQFIPGFEEQVAGHNAGEEFDIDVTFPENYGADELAGKPAVFKVKLHEIKNRELPEIDDEFAKDVSEFDTLKDLKADVKKKALERKKQAAEEDAENRLMDALIECMSGDIPEAMFTNRVKQSVEDFGYRLQSQGLNLEDYLKYCGTTMEELEKTFRPQAEKQVKIRLALEKIVKLEKITATEKEVEEYYEKLAGDYGVEVEKIKAAVPAEEVLKDLAVNKAIDFVKENAVIEEVEKLTEKPAEEKPAEKKPAAKKTATAAKKPADKTDTAEKKPAAKKPAASKTAAAKKTAEKSETAEKKPAAKKPAAKKTSESK